jgi:hypothetical protein
MGLISGAGSWKDRDRDFWRSLRHEFGAAFGGAVDEGLAAWNHGRLAGVYQPEQTKDA